jgi:hypothetical protein
MKVTTPPAGTSEPGRTTAVIVALPWGPIVVIDVLRTTTPRLWRCATLAVAVSGTAAAAPPMSAIAANV